jgi:hypothetical protein
MVLRELSTLLLCLAWTRVSSDIVDYEPYTLVNIAKLASFYTLDDYQFSNLSPNFDPRFDIFPSFKSSTHILKLLVNLYCSKVKMLVDCCLSEDTQINAFILMGSHMLNFPSI